jgi:hypothetical protein
MRLTNPIKYWTVPLLLLSIVSLIAQNSTTEFKVQNRARRIIGDKVFDPASSRFSTIYLREPQQTEQGIIAIRRTFSVERTAGASITTQINQTQSRTVAETEVVWSNSGMILLYNCIMSDISLDNTTGEYYVKAVASKPVPFGDSTIPSYDLGTPEITSVFTSSSRTTNAVMVSTNAPSQAAQQATRQKVKFGPFKTNRPLHFGLQFSTWPETPEEAENRVHK